MTLTNLLKWIPWCLIPRGSISHDGFGHFLVIWPVANEQGLDLAWVHDRTPFVHEDPEAKPATPKVTFDPAVPFECPGGKVEVLRKGLTASQIQAFLASTPESGSTPEQVLESIRTLIL